MPGQRSGRALPGQLPRSRRQPHAARAEPGERWPPWPGPRQPGPARTPAQPLRRSRHTTPTRPSPAPETEPAGGRWACHRPCCSPVSRQRRLLRRRRSLRPSLPLPRPAGGSASAPGEFAQCPRRRGCGSAQQACSRAAAVAPPGQPWPSPPRRTVQSAPPAPPPPPQRERPASRGAHRLRPRAASRPPRPWPRRASTAAFLACPPACPSRAFPSHPRPAAEPPPPLQGRGGPS
mmetsp:Transcript_18641/g.70796  ORF Transcript_18641/g.70796 Transcript_18641/m.70796 type:complete len:234 (-) Transcript_18641:405-1106(-)